jgi:hypothetical protein
MTAASLWLVTAASPASTDGNEHEPAEGGSALDPRVSSPTTLDTFLKHFVSAGVECAPPPKESDGPST